MKLYYKAGSCSLAAHIVLREAGLTAELKPVDLGKKTLEDGSDYLRINSKGYVPALQLDDGAVLTEVATVLQYLADQKPDSGLAPRAGTLQRYRLQEWLAFISSEIHKSFGVMFNPVAGPEWKTGAIGLLKRRLEWLNGELKSSYLLGEIFTVADAYLFVTLNWSGFVGIDLAQWPALKQFHARVVSRPKVQEAMKAEGLLG